MKKWNERSTTERAMIILILVLLVCIFLRWDFIRHEISDTARRYFGPDTTIRYTPK